MWLSFFSPVALVVLNMSGAAALIARAGGLVVPNKLPGAWAYQGCWTDVGRTINAAFLGSKTLTNEACINYCSGQGYQYAGTEYYQECYCGSSLAPTAAQGYPAYCNTPCTGNASQACGGSSYLSLFYSSQPVGPQPAAGTNGWSYTGCYSEGTNGRALSFTPPGLDNTLMTAAYCTQTCASYGYTISGVEYSGECYCDNTIRNGGAPATSGCTNLCNGNSSTICGGPNRLSLYQLVANRGTTTTMTVTTNTGTGTTTTAPTTTTSNAGVSTTTTTGSGTTTASRSSTITTASGSGTSTTATGTTTTASTTTTSNAGVSTTTTAGSGTTTTASGSSTITTASGSGTFTNATGSSTTTASTSVSTTTATSLGPYFNTTMTGSSTTTPGSTTATSTPGSTNTTTGQSTTTTAHGSTTTTGQSTTTTAHGSTTTSSSTTTLASTTTSTTVGNALAQPTVPGQPATIGNWKYNGCQTEATNGRALSLLSTTSGQMTLEACAAFCSAYQYFGTEYASECYCGNAFNPGSVPAPVADCTTTCAGSTGANVEYCGAGGRLSTYSNTAYSALVHKPTVGTYSFVGCWNEGVNVRALAASTMSSDTMTLEMCANFCSPYRYWGTEYGRECYCGNTLDPSSNMAPISACSTACVGNAMEFCGSGSHLDLYEATSAFTTGGGSGTTTASGTGTTTTGSGISTTTTAATGTNTGTASTTVTGTTTSTTSTSTPPPGMPAGWTSRGCWTEGVNGRALNGYQFPDSNTLTQEICATECQSRGWDFSGTEFGAQCFCGNFTQNGAGLVADTQCNMACAGKASEMCGAGNHLTIWGVGTLVNYAVPAPVTTGIGDWTYQGCVQDNINDKRTFIWAIYIFENIMTPLDCLNRCAAFGYMAAGLEYGQECYCGDPGNIAAAGAQFVTTGCNIACAGQVDAICGGGSLMSTYFWTGTPFYTFNYPQNPYYAGEYEFLIGGVTVPLMTMQSITGKVTFLSKGPGTAEGNETGAYELDLSLENDIFHAWREMHVKTDVFCSAGLTLPDRVGRQLTVGGWAEESLRGNRLYWPNGSNGVNGTNDWQENGAELALQGERWYPTVMQLQNGSILVIGGEECSNCAPTPSLEILPYTGTAPIIMDWLVQTDPNNLYPFMVVLPSGNLFAGYWNQARILDAGTFNTVRTLPNMPCSPGDDTTGGRTYPQQGAMVLLPLVAPYNNPLTVLICGGSTSFGDALDNCISTTPDVVGAPWVLERMPSFRVMPCIAPLPDGTYFIGNGAIEGKAGFGLATTGNLNSLIYDPSKPVGSRITIGANTTIQRLYHSEAITLLDGRVLITGSDPTGSVETSTATLKEEYRVEVWIPPYLLSGYPRNSFNLHSQNQDWSYGETIQITLGSAPMNGAITASLLGAVSSTHGNSMGARTIIPAIACAGLTCLLTAPPANIAPPGWYQFFVLDGGIPCTGRYVRIGGDPAKLGDWPPYPDFTVPGSAGPVIVSGR